MADVFRISPNLVWAIKSASPASCPSAMACYSTPLDAFLPEAVLPILQAIISVVYSRLLPERFFRISDMMMIYLKRLSFVLVSLFFVLPIDALRADEPISLEQLAEQGLEMLDSIEEEAWLAEYQRFAVEPYFNYGPAVDPEFRESIDVFRKRCEAARDSAYMAASAQQVFEAVPGSLELNDADVEVLVGRFSEAYLERIGRYRAGKSKSFTFSQEFVWTAQGLRWNAAFVQQVFSDAGIQQLLRHGSSFRKNLRAETLAIHLRPLIRQFWIPSFSEDKVQILSLIKEFSGDGLEFIETHSQVMKSWDSFETVVEFEEACLSALERVDQEVSGGTDVASSSLLATAKGLHGRLKTVKARSLPASEVEILATAYVSAIKELRVRRLNYTYEQVYEQVFRDTAGRRSWKPGVVDQLLGADVGVLKQLQQLSGKRLTIGHVLTILRPHMARVLKR